jgi:integrase
MVAELHGVQRYCPKADNTRRKARELLAELVRDRDAGLDPRKVRLGDYLRRWLNDVRPHLAPATWRKHESIIRVHLSADGRLGAIPLSRLGVADVRAYLGRGNRHPQTLRHHRATLRRALADAVRDGLVTKNVAALAEAPRMTRKERPFLTGPQARRLIDGTRDDRLHGLWVVAVTTGLRLAECLGLAWSDVDLDTGVFRVRYQLARQDGQWVRVAPKTTKSRRTIPLPAVTVEALKRHRERQRALIGDGPVPIDGLVFTTERGHPIHGPNVLPVLYETLERLGLPRVRFHDLRHACASMLLKAGWPVERVAMYLGHSTPRVTLEIYAHVKPEDMKEGAALMERMVGDG